MEQRDFKVLLGLALMGQQGYLELLVFLLLDLLGCREQLELAFRALRELDWLVQRAFREPQVLAYRERLVLELLELREIKDLKVLQYTHGKEYGTIILLTTRMMLLAILDLRMSAYSRLVA
jgi:hypothetical protein